MSEEDNVMSVRLRNLNIYIEFWIFCIFRNVFFIFKICGLCSNTLISLLTKYDIFLGDRAGETWTNLAGEVPEVSTTTKFLAYTDNNYDTALKVGFRFCS